MKSCEKFVAPDSEYYIYAPSGSALEIFFYPLQCGHFTYEPGYCLSRDSFDSFLLMYIQKGRLSLALEDRNLPVGEGQFVLLDCYRRHSYSSLTGWECLWCHFDGPLARPWYNRIAGHLGNAFSMADPQPALSKLAAIYDVFAKGELVREPLLSKYLTDILTSFLLYTPPETRNYHYMTMAEETITYINEHFRENISIEDLARHAGLSQYHFIRIFKKETGCTPHEYIINTRINTAKYLLKNTNIPVKDICFDSGFSNESVFCAAFKRRQGLTPVQYRMSETCNA